MTANLPMFWRNCVGVWIDSIHVQSTPPFWCKSSCRMEWRCSPASHAILISRWRLPRRACGFCRAERRRARRDRSQSDQGAAAGARLRRRRRLDRGKRRDAGLTVAYLRLRTVVKSYDGNNNAVDNISIAVERGEFVTFLGPSGSGKTTTLLMIAGFETPTSGIIELDGHDLTLSKPYQR